MIEMKYSLNNYDLVTKRGVKSFSTQVKTPTNNQGVTIGKAKIM
jgi:hypothetical protein